MKCLQRSNGDIKEDKTFREGMNSKMAELNRPQREYFQIGYSKDMLLKLDELKCCFGKLDFCQTSRPWKGRQGKGYL